LNKLFIWMLSGAYFRDFHSHFSLSLPRYSLF
jgi:hypothetical protein